MCELRFMKREMKEICEDRKRNRKKERENIYNKGNDGKRKKGG